MVSRRRQVIVVGSGEVFRRLYVTGNRHLPEDRRLCFSHIVDVVPEENLQKWLTPELVGNKFKLWRLRQGYQNSLRSLTRQLELTR